MECLLCSSSNLDLWQVFAKPQGKYWHCQDCDFIFMDPSQARLAPEVEKARYEMHENQESEGYRRFFDPLREQLKALLPPEKGQKLLDFGCGPTQYLSDLLTREDGYQVQGYDPYFYPQEELLQAEYSGVISTEVFEHFYEPAKSFVSLVHLVSPAGYLFVLTSPRPSARHEFEKWHYRRDPTHVGFFGFKSMSFLAQKHSLRLVLSSENLWIFQKIP